jgi:hypothetical protein
MSIQTSINITFVSSGCKMSEEAGVPEAVTSVNFDIEV